MSEVLNSKCQRYGQVMNANDQKNEITDIYPFNMALRIFGDKETSITIYIPGVDKALATLTEREADILKMRYSEKMTLKQIGKIYGIGQERVRQIEAKALRKMRHPSRTVLYKSVSVKEFRDQKEAYQKLSADYELIRTAFENIAAKPASQIVEISEILQTPIEEVNFSTRTYNCLYRAGKNTLGDIVEMTERELMNVRNLGRKSADEVKQVLKEYGLELKGMS